MKHRTKSNKRATNKQNKATKDGSQKPEIAEAATVSSGSFPESNNSATDTKQAFPYTSIFGPNGLVAMEAESEEINPLVDSASSKIPTTDFELEKSPPRNMTEEEEPTKLDVILKPKRKRQASKSKPKSNLETSKKRRRL